METKAIKCPSCGIGNMVERESKKYHGTFFWSCDRYPSCRTSFNKKQFQSLLSGQTVIETQKPTRKYNAPSFIKGSEYPKEIAGTNEQRDIWDAILDGNNVVVDALAGTGKTTSIIQACARCGPDCFIIVVAFNKRVADEILPKLPPNSTALTIHKLGFIAVQQAFGHLQPNSYKSRNMLADKYGLNGLEGEEATRLLIDIKVSSRIIGLCKTNLIYHPNEQDIDHITTLHGLDVVNYGQVVDMVKWVMSCYYKEEIIRRYSIDFDDMIILPVYLNLPIPQADAVIVDEAQDLSAARRELILRVSDQVIAVGDTNQAIYGFTGADTYSMENISSALDNPIHLPLTINWRCGRKHIQLAQVLVPDIKAHDNAPEGYIYEINDDTFMDLVKPGHMVLCRTNAPMVSYVYKLLKMGIGATIAGKDFGEDLEALVRKLSGMGRKDSASKMSLPALVSKLEDYLTTESDKLSKRRNAEMLIEQLGDKISTLFTLIDQVKSVEELIQEINKLFRDIDGDNPNIVVFYSVHKSKGGENKNVFILEPQLLPHPKAQGEENKKQEINLLYVAVTRVWSTDTTNGNLYFVGSMPEMLRSRCANLIDTLSMTGGE